MTSKNLIISGLIFMLPVLVHGQAERKYVRQGNKQYKEEVFDESEILYRKALEKEQQSYSGEFNLGDAMYKQEKFEDAARSFHKLAENQTDPIKLGELYHNLGNSFLKANQLEASIEAYKQSLRNNPADNETRHNLAYAQQMQQQQQDQKDQDQNQDKQDQDQNQDKQDQDKDKQDQDQNQDKDKQDQDQNQDQQDQNQDQQQQQQQPQISREDAQRMLQALQQDEQDLQEKLKKQKAQATKVKVLKDW
ncbi:MAG: tetratricopeptide repeat protein [Bacteroidales bacterium]|nr:tetratricopeptide repeat protein [Bacteroidales bacterium]